LNQQRFEILPGRIHLIVAING